MSERTIALHSTVGGADKVYNINLIASEGGWVVQYQNGRRGGTLTTGYKTKTPVSIEEANRIFDKVANEKQRSGYLPIDASTGAAIAPADPGARFLPQLLNAVTPAQVEELIESADYFAQEKADGERRVLRIEPDGVTAFNKKGNPVPVAAGLMPGIEALRAAGVASATIDGELIGETLHAFDLLELNGQDLSGEQALIRAARVIDLLGALPPGFAVLPLASTAGSKRALYERVREAGGEGVVFKRCRAGYSGGRPASGGNALKFKFTESATCRVIEASSSKRSVALELIDTDSGLWTFVGNVTIPPNHAIPSAGAIVEVSYLYAFRCGGSLFQPCYRGERTDQDTSDCRLDQLRYKGEAAPQREAA